ncbi:DNA-3-methyladenine glycosylase [Methylobacterium durans]|uniref:DNA-3-methyladenine glycosylase family protein n=1 Tax=Methylobacterium durans TaxID=2202825 RepID=UPI002AFE2A5D|nr:DNA-3-methyladenine glycosylase [Methylobacterium durans]MEA1833718.1 DNA-3-methyladenine glycosylase [Methylobacterium durans]
MMDDGHSATLPVNAPYDWATLVAFLAARAIPGVEVVEADRYRRTLCRGGRHGAVTIEPGEGELRVFLDLPDRDGRAAILARLAALFDTQADPGPIAARLAADPALAPLVKARPGLRVPGAFDGFEMAVRAILGQQVSVAAATGLAGRLVAAFGTPLAPAVAARAVGLTHLFPNPEVLAGADVAAALNMPRARGRAISALAAAVLREPDLFAEGQGLEAALARLTALPGIGPWTAQYIAMRALREPDALPVGDIGLLRALDRGRGRPSPAALLAQAEGWRPWRAYAALHLWTGDAARIAEQGAG